MRPVKTNLIFLLVFLLASSVLAQPGQRRMQDERMRAIESRRIAYITEKMDLTPSEARVFWPIYNEYQGKLEELNARHRAWNEELDSREEVSEAEAKVFAEREVQRFEEIARLKRVYHEKFHSVLPASKILRLYEAEKSFNRLLFRESQHRMRERRN